VRTTATRATRGATCLSNSSNFALRPNSLDHPVFVAQRLQIRSECLRILIRPPAATNSRSTMIAGTPWRTVSEASCSLRYRKSPSFGMTRPPAPNWCKFAKASRHQRRAAANPRTSLPLLRRPHDHHRAVRTRLNSALSPEPANPSNQDRYVMILAIRSLCLNPVRFFRCRSAEHVSARVNFFARVTNYRSTVAPLAPRRSSQTRGALHAAQSLRLSPRTTANAARSPLKSP
jgi:hypothetical protein